MEDVGPPIRALVASAEGWRERDPAEPSALTEELLGAGEIAWIDVDVTRSAPRTVGRLGEAFGLHELAMEDAINTRQRPKLEPYEAHLFLVLHQLDELEGQLEPRQIAVFLGERHVLVFHEAAHRTVEDTRRRLSAAFPEDGWRADVVLHTLLDAVVDDYAAIADRLEEEVELIEELVLGDPRLALLRQIYSVMQRVSRLRRYALPVGRILDLVVEPGRPPHLDEAIAAHFRDVHDHALRIADQVRNIDDLAEAILGLTRAEQAAAQNEVTKRLTAWAAIIAVPTFLSSVYGMNFALIPREGSLLGFQIVLGAMAAIAVGLFAFFKRRGWL